MEIEIPNRIRTVLDRLEQNGFEAYIVGGCVRDALMGRIPHDFDITTSALPEQTMSVFKDLRVIPTGLKHGTITVLSEGEPLEITTFRVDGAYSDNRRPDSVSFTRSVTEDLSRRDFTMNAIAYSPTRGIIDPLGGAEDIRRGVIRCVGNPDLRFGEDALRIMRALRFAVVLGFEIEEQTSKSIIENRNLLNNIAAERITAELCKMLSSPLTAQNIRRILRDYREVFGVIIPELTECFDYNQHSKYHCFDVYEHIIFTVQEAASLTPENHILPIAMLLHDIAKPRCMTRDADGTQHYLGHAKMGAEMAEQILRRLKFDNASREKIAGIVLDHDLALNSSDRIIKKRLSRLGLERFRLCALAHIADDRAKAEPYRSRSESYPEMISRAEQLAPQYCMTVKQLAINGRDLSAIIPPSPQMGVILNKLLREVIEGRLKNEKSALMKRAEKLVKT